MDKTQKDLDLYFLTRNVQWRYRLDQYEDAVIAEMLKTVRAAVADVQLQLFNGDAVPRGDALLDELQALSAGLRKRLGEDVADMATEALNYSAQEHASILSIDNRVPINNVALSADQFRAFLGGPAGGVSLPAWVDAAWGNAVTEQVKRNLNIAVLQGESYQKAVRGLLESTIADFTEREAVTIARTYVQTANVAAQMSLYEANDDLVTGWKWSSVLEPGYSKTGRGTCLRCQSLDQRRFKMGEGPPIPLHPRCVTGDTLISAPGVVAAIRIKYSGPIIDIRIDGGNTLSCTPNHRIMTDRGVKFAGDIQKGDKVIYDRAHAEGIHGSKDHYGLPTKAEDIFHFFADRFELFKAEPTSPGVDLHGDELFVEGDIDIVAPKSLLRGDFETLLFQDLKDMFLPSSNVSDAFLPGLSKSTSMLVRMGLSAQSVSRFLSVFDALLFCHSGESKNGALARSAWLNSCAGKVAPDGSLVGPEMIRDFIRTKAAGVHGDNFLDGELDRIWMLCADLAALHGRSSFVAEGDALPDKSAFDWLSSPPEEVANLFLGLSSSVELRDVEFVGERSFNGHVYDLQSISSTYYNEGMLSSNCRCVALPVMKTWRELGLDRDELDAAIRPYTIRPDANIDAGGMRTIIESGRHQGDYASWWAKQPEAFKINAVGPGRYELLKSGKISFADLVDGDGRQRTLKELMGGQKSALIVAQKQLHPFESMRIELDKKYGIDKIYSMATDSELEKFELLERDFYMAQKDAGNLAQATVKVKSAAPDAYKVWADSDDVRGAIGELMEKAWDDDGYDYFGVRVNTDLTDMFSEATLRKSGIDPKKKPVYKVGDILEPSFVWDDNELTNEMLEGTSTLIVKRGDAKSIQNAVKLLNQYAGRDVILAAGEDALFGQDEGELILKNAKVLNIWKRK